MAEFTTINCKCGTAVRVEHDEDELVATIEARAMAICPICENKVSHISKPALLSHDPSDEEGFGAKPVKDGWDKGWKDYR